MVLGVYRTAVTGVDQQVVWLALIKVGCFVGARDAAFDFPYRIEGVSRSLFSLYLISLKINVSNIISSCYCIYFILKYL